MARMRLREVASSLQGAAAVDLFASSQGPASMERAFKAHSLLKRKTSVSHVS